MKNIEKIKNDKKNYESPVLEVIKLDRHDIVTESQNYTTEANKGKKTQKINLKLYFN